MTRPRAVSCRYLRMRPMAVAQGGGTEQKPLSAAICENQKAPAHGQVLLDAYDVSRWPELETCRGCTLYQPIRP